MKEIRFLLIQDKIIVQKGFFYKRIFFLLHLASFDYLVETGNTETLFKIRRFFTVRNHWLYENVKGDQDAKILR